MKELQCIWTECQHPLEEKLYCPQGLVVDFLEHLDEIGLLSDPAGFLSCAHIEYNGKNHKKLYDHETMSNWRKSKL